MLHPTQTERGSPIFLSFDPVGQYSIGIPQEGPGIFLDHDRGPVMEIASLTLIPVCFSMRVRLFARTLLRMRPRIQFLNPSDFASLRYGGTNSQNSRRSRS